MTRTTVQISGMICGMCEAHVNDAVRAAFQVKKVSSSRNRGETVIESEEPLDHDKLRQVIGNTVMECDSLTVICDGESTVLPQKEFMLLYKMASFPGKIFTRQQLMDEIWGYDTESDTHTVDVHIGRLRERFRENNDFKIVTMRGVGYKVVKN